MRNFLVLAVLATTGHAAAEDSPLVSDFSAVANAPQGWIFQVNKNAGHPIVTIEMDGSVLIALGTTVDEAAEKTYESANFKCTKDLTYTYEFVISDNDHYGHGRRNWSVALKPDGRVVYVGLTPTPVADSYFHKLAALAGSGECRS